MSRTIIEATGKIYTNRILHTAFWGTIFTENCMWGMILSEKYSFEGWIFKINIVLGAINIRRNCVCLSVTEYKV